MFDVFVEIDLHFLGAFVGGQVGPRGSRETRRRVTDPQLDFPREKIQNRGAILNFFEFVVLEAGHQGKPPGSPGRAREGLGWPET